MKPSAYVAGWATYTNIRWWEIDEPCTPHDGEHNEAIGIMTCLRCGAGLLLDPADHVNVIRIHDEWHEKLTA